MLFPLLASASFAVGFWGYQLHSRQGFLLTDYLAMEYLLASNTSTGLAQSPIQRPLLRTDEPAHSNGKHSQTLQSLLLALKDHRYPESRPFRIMQIGDSHTAGDFFTERLRMRLQTQYGNAGIGWILPGPVRGQSSARYRITMSGPWELQVGSSRGEIAPLPLGGYLNRGRSGASLFVSPTGKSPGSKWIFAALVRSSPKARFARVSLSAAGQSSRQFSVGSSWQLVELSTQSPLQPRYTFDVVMGGVDVAGLWLENDLPGVVVDHLGRNGATISYFDQWSNDSIAALLSVRPIDAIILAYGTNEASDRITAPRYLKQIITAVSRLRLISPSTPIVLISSPSYTQGSPLRCPTTLPASIRSVISAQQAAARIPGVQVWDWMQAMGGECAVSTWYSNGLIASDGIHMKPQGYWRSADLFLDWLQKP